MKLLTQPPKTLSENQIYQLTLWFRVLGVLFVCFLAFGFLWSFLGGVFVCLFVLQYSNFSRSSDPIFKNLSSERFLENRKMET